MTAVSRRRLWPLVAALTTALLFGVVTTLWGEGVGTPNDTTWFQFFIVALGGAALLVLYQTRQDASAMKQALLGYGDTPGLVATVRELGLTVEGMNVTVEGMKDWMPREEGHRKSLNQSVSRIDGIQGDLVRRVERVEAYLEGEVGPAVGRPFAYPPDLGFHGRRDREA